MARKYLLNFARLTVLMLTLLLVLTNPVLAQEADDSEARAVVIQAMDNLAEGYQYIFDWNGTQRLIGEDEEISIYTQQSITGKVTAEGDYSVTVEAYGGETPDTIANMPLFEMQQISVDGELYINLGSLDRIFGNLFEGVELGWQRYQDLLAEFDNNTAQRVAFESLTNIILPSDFPLTDNLILSVTELEPETSDETDMRVFEVELDAAHVLISQTPATALERLQMALEAADFFAKSELSLTYTLWIGAEDGHLYRGESTGYNFLPYLTEDEPGPPYDIETQSSAEFIISQHGTVDAISLPEEIQR